MKRLSSCSRVPIILFLFAGLFLSCNNTKNEGSREKEGAQEKGVKTTRQLKGKVVGISDGDTFRLLTEGNKTERIRLYGIDAPERGQEYGTQSKNALSDLIFGKEVQVQQKQRDRYGRVVGIAFVDDVNVNETLLKRGSVWHYTQFDKSKQWAMLQKQAQAAGAGLWQMPDPTPPWEWRKTAREKKEN